MTKKDIVKKIGKRISEDFKNNNKPLLLMSRKTKKDFDQLIKEDIEKYMNPNIRMIDKRNKGKN